eukprot:TRINITY_DN2006_c1_g1_i6.p1 TRINITY_DN2006_c1_g1~~TRINITY_DN2006_c1_g1_i6.p1  ORF type:complete len:443 (-),score=117.48 TRINITY_DN2006_c1_g1_i6:1124-2452(-)
MLNCGAPPVKRTSSHSGMSSVTNRRRTGSSSASTTQTDSTTSLPGGGNGTECRGRKKPAQVEWPSDDSESSDGLLSDDDDDDDDDAGKWPDVNTTDDGETSEVADDVLWGERAGGRRRSKDGNSSIVHSELTALEKQLSTLTECIHTMHGLLQQVREGKRATARQQLRKHRTWAQELCANIEVKLRALVQLSNRSARSRSNSENRETTTTAHTPHVDDTAQRSLAKLQASFRDLRKRVDQMDRDSRSLLVSSTSVSLESSLFMEDYNGQRQDSPQHSPPQQRSPHQQQQQQQQQQQSRFDEDVFLNGEKEELDRLEKEMLQVLELFKRVNDLVQEQQPFIDRMEENCVQSEADTSSVVGELAKASHYGAYSLPLIGAAVGGMVMGPVGAVVGAKGALALAGCVLGGMGMGAWAGQKVKDKQRDDADAIQLHFTSPAATASET